MITLLLIIPLLGSLLLLPLSDKTIKGKSQMKKIAMITSLVNFFISLFLWYQFDSNSTQYQFVYEFNQLNYCHFNFGIDGISIYFVLLTTFVTPIALLSNYTNITKNLKFFLIAFLILETLQICAFVSLDLLLFYIFFESVKCFGSTLLCLQLSNSGDTLKLMVPNYSRKAISGWTNSPCTVISHMMSENEMGYRGSKSVFKMISVKEQRVDGSCFINHKLMKLRCTLMGFERNYQISNPSKQIFINNFKLHTKMPCLKRSFYTQTKHLILIKKNFFFFYRRS
jgi:hypothetical protein